MRAGCCSFKSVSAWRSLPFSNRFCLRFYCPTEANPGAGSQQTVANFMTINSIWSKESLIIIWGCPVRVFLPESVGQGGGSKFLLRTHQARWGPLGYLPLLHIGGGEERWKAEPRKGTGEPSMYQALFIKPDLFDHQAHLILSSVHPCEAVHYSHFPDEKS